MATTRPSGEGAESTFSGGEATSDGESSQTPSVTVIIPTYNEAKNIENVITQVSDALTHVSSEILVVDDNSPDGTAELVRDIFGDSDSIRVIKRVGKENGLSKSVLDGFQSANGEYYVVIDADLQHPPAKIPSLLTACRDGAEVAVGSRHHPEGGIEDWSKSREIVSDGAKCVSRIATPASRQTTDPMSGFFAVHSGVVDGVELEPKGYKILLEVLDRCDVDEVVDVPYYFRERQEGESKLTVGEYLNFIEHSGVMFFRRLGAENPDKWVRMLEFMAVGGVGAVVNMAVFFLAHTVSGIFYMASAAIAFSAAVVFNFVADWFVTFDQPDGSIPKQFLAFCGTCIGGFIIHLTTLTAFVELANLSPLLGNFAGILAGFLWNFGVSDSFIFD